MKAEEIIAQLAAGSITIEQAQELLKSADPRPKERRCWMCGGELKTFDEDESGTCDRCESEAARGALEDERARSFSDRLASAEHYLILPIFVVFGVVLLLLMLAFG